MRARRYFSRVWPNGAFTLIEMIVVIAIIGLLVALTAPGLLHTMQANRLTSAGQNMLGRLAQAQQMASSVNKAVEVRFYKYTDPEDMGIGEQFQAYQFFTIDVETNAAGTSSEVTKAMGPPFFLEAGVVVSSSSVNSSAASPLLIDSRLLNDGSGGSGNPRFFERADARYVAIRFYPDGIVRRMMSGAVPGNPGIRTAEEVFLPDAYLTLVADTDASGSGTVANFFAIQIDPYTGHTRTFQPEL